MEGENLLPQIELWHHMCLVACSHTHTMQFKKIEIKGRLWETIMGVSAHGKTIGELQLYQKWWFTCAQQHREARGACAECVLSIKMRTTALFLSWVHREHQSFRHSYLLIETTSKIQTDAPVCLSYYIKLERWGGWREIGWVTSGTSCLNSQMSLS